jgi:DNA primase
MANLGGLRGNESGIEGMSFYEKRLPSHFPDFVSTVEVHTADGAQRQVVVNDARSLVYLAQQACLTPIRGSRALTTSTVPTS